MDARISPAALQQALQSTEPPLVVDVRRAERFLESPYMLQGALRRDPAHVDSWKDQLPGAPRVVVYCVHGHEVSQQTAMAMGATYLEGGLEAWREAGGALSAKPRGASTRWITRERPKIDRIACPWLVRRFIDAEAEFLYVPGAQVRRLAAEREATPYDVPEVELSHVADKCSFDAFMRMFNLKDPALERLALIVRAADTSRLDLAPQAAGLAAISLGLSRNFANDHEMLEHGMVMYDALYASCRVS
jgi:rhodanese-related sulfurtransferase